MSSYKFTKSDKDKRIESINKKALSFIVKKHFERKILKKIIYISQVYIKDLQKGRFFAGYLPFDDVFEMVIDFKSNKFLPICKEKINDIFNDEYLKIGNYLLRRKANIIEQKNRFSIEIKYKAVVCVLNSDRELEINKLLKQYFNQDYQTGDFFSFCHILGEHSDKEILSIIADDVIQVLKALSLENENE